MLFFRNNVPAWLKDVMMLNMKQNVTSNENIKEITYWLHSRFQLKPLLKNRFNQKARDKILRHQFAKTKNVSKIMCVFRATSGRDVSPG